MAATPTQYADDADRNRAAPVTRRQLLTARGSHEAPPRIVLHLPDLDALSAVAIGPPQSAARRRIDPPHAVVTEFHDEPTASKSSRVASAVRRQLFSLVKAPVGKVVEEIAPNGQVSLTRLLVVLQSPKILLAGVAAIGLQLAAILAMFTGGTATTAPSDPPSDAASAPQVALPSGPPSNGAAGPIQTPLYSPYGQYLATPGSGGSVVVVQPMLPPPQTLPGIDPRDVPPWGGNTTAPLANQPAVLPSPSPSLTPTDGTPKSTPSAQTSDAGGKPKARLQGTIKKASISEITP